MLGAIRATSLKYPTPGQSKSLKGFLQQVRALDPALAAEYEGDPDVSALARPCKVFEGRVAGNRFAVHPMEGWDGTGDGKPTEHTLRRWHRFGSSTAKLIWGGEAYAVQRDGRANPRQLFMNPSGDPAADLAALRTALFDGHRSAGEKTDDLVVGLQLTHSGRFASPDGYSAPRPAVHGPALDASMNLAPDAPVLTDAEIEGIGENIVRAAVLARNAGFDFVDVKCCHGYLLHELLGARERQGPYGGSFENRTRFLQRVIQDIRSACPDLGIAARVSVGDLAPYRAPEEGGPGRPVTESSARPYLEGFGVDQADPRRMDHAEPMELLGLLGSLAVKTINVSLGSPYTTPHLQRPAAHPPSDGYAPPEDPLSNVLDHLRAVRACREAFPDFVLVGSGYSYLMEHLPHVAAHEVERGHADFVGLGRMMLSYPDLPADILAGRSIQRRRLCRTFSDCVNATRAGIRSGCYPLDEHFANSNDAEAVRRIRGELKNRRA